MEIIKTDIEGPIIIEPKIFGDARGYFFESFSQREFDEPTNEAKAESSVPWAKLCEEEENRRSYETSIPMHCVNYAKENELMY